MRAVGDVVSVNQSVRTGRISRGVRGSESGGIAYMAVPENHIKQEKVKPVMVAAENQRAAVSGRIRLWLDYDVLFKYNHNNGLGCGRVRYDWKPADCD